MGGRASEEVGDNIQTVRVNENVGEMTAQFIPPTIMTPGPDQNPSDKTAANIE